MALRIPSPGTVVDLAVTTAGQVVAAAAAVASAPGRVLRLIDEGEVLLVRIAAVVDAAEKAVEDVRGVAEEAAKTSASAGLLVGQVTETSESARALVNQIGPDVHELLGVTREVQQAINGIPGFGMFRRRGAEQDGDL